MTAASHFASFVGEAHGSVHSGEGAQYNIYYQSTEQWLREQARRRPRSVAEEDRRHLHERFVAPLGLQHARALLQAEHTVLVRGHSGSGRRAAALMLLHELPVREGTLHELPDTSDDSTGPPLDGRDVGRGDRLLLDLSEADETRYIAAQSALSDFRSSVAANDAYLVVVLPHHLGYLLRGDLRYLMAEISRPSARRVLATHLKCAGIHPSEALLGSADLISFLARAPLRDVAALADRVNRLRMASPADRGLPDWLKQALEEQHDQTERVAAVFSAAQNGHRRALQLAVAMFHEATPDVVLYAANGLLGLLSHPPDPTPRLEQADLYAELSAVHAEMGPDGLVRFTVHGYDRAVRQHFWTFLPDIRQELRDWLMRQAANPALDAAVRREAVNRFAHQALRVARPEDLAWLAQQWTAFKAPAWLIPEAARVLVLGLEDDHHGRFFRQRIYDWAASDDTSVHCLRVLIMVCSQTMARSHPDQALVRLHHLARRSREEVRWAARKAMVQLSAADDRLYQLMLERLAAGVSQRSSRADLDIFRDLPNPVRLIRRRSVRHYLAVCWAGLLSGTADWPAHLRLWLGVGETAAERDLIAQVLASACAQDTRLFGRLYRAALDWVRSRPEPGRADMASRLLLAINEAQGIHAYGRTA
ncbi:hypothetical protein [Streptomyces achromogenes]|uniref:hypothetical protein n=1 Tax=Streptomyces achromogenes TaxID=67255 RepID=UPI003675F077